MSKGRAVSKVQAVSKGRVCAPSAQLFPDPPVSHWRDCHFADTTSAFSRCFNRHGEGVSAE